MNANSKSMHDPRPSRRDFLKTLSAVALATGLAVSLGRVASYSGQLVTWDEACNSQLDLSPQRLDWDADPPVRPGPDGQYATPIPGIAKAY